MRGGGLCRIGENDTCRVTPRRYIHIYICIFCNYLEIAFSFNSVGGGGNREITANRKSFSSLKEKKVQWSYNRGGENGTV